MYKSFVYNYNHSALPFHCYQTRIRVEADMASKILLLLALSIAFTFLISSQVAARDLAETTLKTERASLDGSSYYAGGVGGSRSHPAASAYSRGGGSHDNGDGETYKAIPIGGGCYNRYECN